MEENILDPKNQESYRHVQRIIRTNTLLKLQEASKKDGIEIAEITDEDHELLVMDHWISNIEQKTERISITFCVHFFSKSAKILAKNSFPSSKNISSRFSHDLIQEFTNIVGGAIKVSMVSMGAEFPVGLGVNLPEKKPSYDKVSLRPWAENIDFDAWKMLFDNDAVYCTSRINLEDPAIINDFMKMKTAL